MTYVVTILCFIAFFGMPANLCALDLGTPRLSGPQQQEKFFNIERLAVEGDAKTKTSLLEPLLAVSHDVREDEIGQGMMQVTHRVHGEAGGKLKLIGDVTLSAVAKIPVYIYGVTGKVNAEDSATSSELLRNTGRLFWRSELGIPLGEGVGLSLFYDRSAVGKIDKPGIDATEEKFGTQFIFRFK